MADGILTAERLRELLHYAPETGVFTRKTRRGNRALAGATAGSMHSGGYTEICVDGVSYLAHRLAWLHTHGRWPANEIDHINGVRNDNRLVNLREATRAENAQNQRAPRSRNSSGHIGVYWSKENKNWVARITISYKTTHIGCFPTPEGAHAAYVEAKRRLHPAGTL